MSPVETSERGPDAVEVRVERVEAAVVDHIRQRRASRSTCRKRRLEPLLMLPLPGAHLELLGGLERKGRVGAVLLGLVEQLNAEVVLVLLLVRQVKAVQVVHLAHHEQEDGVGHDADGREGQVEPVGFERGHLEVGDGHVAL